MSDAQLDQQLRTILARLELVSTAPTQRYDASGGDGDSIGPSGGASPVDRYRRRLIDIDQGLQRRIDATEATGDWHERDAEQAKAREWHHDARASVLTDATRELAQLTGRDGHAPERHHGKLDTQKGIEEAISEDAPGKPAEQVASKLGLSVFIVRRRYAELGLYPVDGSAIAAAEPDDESLATRVKDMKRRGMTQTQIGKLVGRDQATVSRLLRKPAA